MSARAAKKKTAIYQVRDIKEVLRDIPTEQFLKMVNKSGLLTSNARELMAAFRNLKAE